MPKQGLRPGDFDLEFFFKKSWDKFTEPLLEYGDLLNDAEKKELESKGAKSRAITALKKRLEESAIAAREAIPNFDFLPPNSKERRQALARAYEGYASYVKAHGNMLMKAFDEDKANRENGRDPFFLRTYLGVLKPRPGTSGDRDIDW